jgi:predicted nucleotide-binding protein
MDPAARDSAIQAIASELVGLSEAEADGILTGVGLDATVTGWGRSPLLIRRVQVVTRLMKADDSAIQYLSLGLPPRRASEENSSEAHSGKTTMASKAVSIFVVHGHAKAELYETVRVLERATGLDVVVLHEQANAGRTILEKFEYHAGISSFAVVLLTADDVGRASSGTDLKPRGRQNVIFELGFFFGKLGRNRVVVLLSEGVEEPSDINGLVYIKLDGSGAWKQALARELQSAEISVDYSRIP